MKMLNAFKYQAAQASNSSDLIPLDYTVWGAIQESLPLLNKVDTCLRIRYQKLVPETCRTATHIQESVQASGTRNLHQMANTAVFFSVQVSGAKKNLREKT